MKPLFSAVLALIGDERRLNNDLPFSISSKLSSGDGRPEANKIKAKMRMRRAHNIL